jgi:hypothetical protein
LRRFGRYLREVLRTGWGILFFIAGAISTSVTFVLVYRPSFSLPYWIPGALSIAAWLIAPYKLYRKQEDHIEFLKAQQQQPRRATLVLLEESGSFYIRCFTPTGITPKSETGIYIELWISIENKGDRPATICRYDLRIDEIGDFSNLRPVTLNYVIGRNAQHALNPSEKVKNYIEVLAERLKPHQYIAFMLNATLPPDARQILCELTVTDTDQNNATIRLKAAVRGGVFTSI